jgi:hypothetical protein
MLQIQVSGLVFQPGLGTAGGSSPAGPVFSWAPGTEVAQWTDGAGVHNTDYPTFAATVDFFTLVDVVLDFTGITNLVAHNCPALIHIQANSCYGPLASVDVSNSPALVNLGVTGSGLTSLNVTGCSGLATVYCYSNVLTSLDMSSCPALTYLSCEYNQLGTINLTGCFNLVTFAAFNNPAPVVIGP